MNSDSLPILNRAFLRLQRSLDQYLRCASPVLDVGKEAVETIVARQTDDIERLGRLLAQRQGSVPSGSFPLDFGDYHFVNASRLLPEWKQRKRELIAGLEGDLAAMGQGPDCEGGDLLEEIVEHERDSLARLEQLQPAPASK